MKNHGPHLRIVLTDDDIEDCDMFIEALKMVRSDVKLEVVHNGQQLLHYLQHSADLPHLVFLDLNMPVMDGTETVTAIRKHDRFHSIPVVIFTTSSSEQDIEQTYAKGADGFITKPTCFAQLQEIIRKILETNWNRADAPNGKRSLEQFHLSF